VPLVGPGSRPPLRPDPLGRDDRQGCAPGTRPDRRSDLYAFGHPGHLPLSDPQRRPLLPGRRRSPQGVARRPRAATLLPGDRRILQSPATPARDPLVPTGPSVRRRAATERARELALPRSLGGARRRLVRLHARHGREPTGIPPTLPPEAWLWLPDRADR